MKDSVASEVRLVATDYLHSFEALLHQVDLNALERIVQHLRKARDRSAMIYVAGNGGSAATASHWVNDSRKSNQEFRADADACDELERQCFLVDCIGQRRGIRPRFFRTTRQLARPGDVLIVISASGNSPNLIEAVELARSRAVATIGLLGFDGGALKNKVHECLWLPTEKGAYGLVESAHALLCHILTDCLAKDLAISDKGDEKRLYAR